MVYLVGFTTKEKSQGQSMEQGCERQGQGQGRRTLIDPRWSYHGGRPSVKVCAFMCECVEDAFCVLSALALIGFLGLSPVEEASDVVEAGDDMGTMTGASVRA